MAEPDSLAVENERLIRRLARERATRLQVETIAERGLRDLYVKQRQLGFLEQIATMANRSGSMSGVLADVLTEICHFTDWRVGHAYMLGGHGAEQLLWPTKVWHVDPQLEVAALRACTDNQRFAPGEGLPGLVWSAAAPIWLEDLAEAPTFSRCVEALHCGLRSALGIPLLIETEVVAVVELFTDQVTTPDPELLQILTQVGTQLGRVIERERSRDRLHDALYDALTGLATRPNFINHVERSIESCAVGRGAPFCVLLLDLDRFKLVNDSLGPACGDRLLAAVAARLPCAMEHGDASLLARLGGDEFAALLPGVETADQAAAVADAFHAVLREPFAVLGTEIVTTAGIGLALGHGGSVSAMELLRDADLAMHHAKTLGTGCAAMFNAAMHASAVQRIKLETELRAAVRAEAFVLHYQAIVSLKTDQVVGFEALVRWQTAPGVLRMPGEFIAVAEETGLIVPLGIMVLRQACLRLRDWTRRTARAAPLTMSVNLSPRQFVQPDLIEQVARVIHETGIDAATLRLEITEAVTMDNAERSVQVLTALRGLGVRISIDDFGTGYSCLSYLHRFPLHVLKIDRSFVSRMESNPESLAIVRTILGLARGLGMEVVAEGAETAAEVTLLKSLGCDYCQGFFYSRPLPAEAAEKLLTAAPTRADQTGHTASATATAISHHPARSSIAPAVLSTAMADSSC